ncbi:MAG TPA: hypothetical protein VF337_08625 [Candidatus Limnocylindrales bacterium]
MALSPEVLLPVVVFFAIGVPIVVLLWRVFVVGGQIRRAAQNGRAALDIARRADMSISELAGVVDELRHRKAGPEAIADSLRAAADALKGYEQEAETIDKRSPQAAVAGLKGEIERAERAVELISHGAALMADASLDRVGEGETSVKRGYLNLLHAREAIKERAQVIADAASAPRVASANGRLGGR